MDAVIQLVNRANQRGGRMLSVIDLLDAGTLSRAQACWLLARILRGASFLVGARPGGAGKTAVMGALLTMLPPGETVRLATRGTGWEASRPGDCIVAYEIGRGRFEAYVWGSTLMRMTALGQAGCRIVTNLHADALEEAREQIAVQCGAGEAGLAAFETFISIRTRGRGTSMERVVGDIQWHDRDSWRVFEPDRHVPTLAEGAIAEFLDRCVADGIRTIEAVRSAWLEALPAVVGATGGLH
ncbi:MAG: hypothetical protein R6X16_04650 [Anaerolineae bacterium]